MLNEGNRRAPHLSLDGNPDRVVLGFNRNKDILALFPPSSLREEHGTAVGISKEENTCGSQPSSFHTQGP